VTLGYSKRIMKFFRTFSNHQSLYTNWQVCETTTLLAVDCETVIQIPSQCLSAMLFHSHEVIAACGLFHHEGDDNSLTYCELFSLKFLSYDNTCHVSFQKCCYRLFLSPNFIHV
jgi:hypothetical protein